MDIETIRKQQIGDLLDALQASNQARDILQVRAGEMAAEIERINAEVGELRHAQGALIDRLSELTEENTSMRAERDQLIAQEPVDYERVLNGEWVKCSKTRYEVTSDPVRALYASPIHLQQSPAVAVPDSPAVEKAWSRFQAAINTDNTEDSREQFHSWADEKGFCMDEVWSTVFEPFESEDTQLAWEIWQASRVALGEPSPRITEQDAREIAFLALDYRTEMSKNQCNSAAESISKSEAMRNLLNKLNDKPESVGG